MKQGKLIVISAPSGTGKTTVIKHLLEKLPAAAVIVTTTTRPPRPEETDGMHYYFVSTAEFEDKLARGEFAEHAQYAGNLYGIERRELEEKLAAHSLVLVTPEVKGKRQIDNLGIASISVFLEPEDLNALRERLERRKTLPKDEMERRLAAAKNEMAAAPEYDYRVLNREGRLHEAVDEILGILDREGAL